MTAISNLKIGGVALRVPTNYHVVSFTLASEPIQHGNTHYVATIAVGQRPVPDGTNAISCALTLARDMEEESLAVGKPIVEPKKIKLTNGGDAALMARQLHAADGIIIVQTIVAHVQGTTAYFAMGSCPNVESFASCEEQMERILLSLEVTK